MASSSKPSDLHIANALRLANDDLSAAYMLLAKENRYGAYHLQQCAEKILPALLTSEDLQIERKDSHRLDVLRDKLPDINPFKERSRPLSQLTVFATHIGIRRMAAAFRKCLARPRRRCGQRTSVTF